MAIRLNKPLDDINISNQEKHFMQNLQANILKGHGREHVRMLFLTVKDIMGARKYLHDYPVTDSFSQLDETKKFKEQGIPGGIIRLVFVSKSGLDVFGHGGKFNGFAAFSGGMAKDTRVLDDVKTDSWQTELKKPVHVLLLVAHQDAIELSHEVKKMIHEFDDNKQFDVVLVQEGRAYKNRDGERIEHFGYVDGRSQPLMVQSAINDEKAKIGIDKYDPTTPLGQFILPDPLSPSDFGSFLVFRKLEQNVAGFKRAEEELATTLGLMGEDRERAEAMIVGRFKDGTPITLDKKKMGGTVRNNFDYRADMDGSKCPFHSHIRKSNPRGASPSGLKFDKSVQIVRRGITYGSRLQNPDTKEFLDQPNDGVGVLFMSYQSSIEKQFRFIQLRWASNEKFPRLNVGVDPVIGKSSSIPSTWFPNWNSTKNAKTSLFHGFVTLKGGEYFFTPSIQGVKSL
jgi:Dyp-type peroxidase family